MEIKVNVKQLGKRKASVVPVAYDLPLGADGFFTVRELITELVKSGVAQYHEKLEQQEILKCLTKEEIDDRAQSGKISFGAVYSEKRADTAHAVENAIQCFEDGIYRIFLNDRALEDLEERLTVTQSDTFTFVRLTMLAGRLW